MLSFYEIHGSKDSMPKPKPKKHERGQNPKSLDSLRPRLPIYPEDKLVRRCTVTVTGWDGCKAVVKELGLSGVSELLEMVGRSELLISKP